MELFSIRIQRTFQLVSTLFFERLKCSMYLYLFTIMFYEKLSLVTLFRRQSYIFYLKPKKEIKKKALKINDFPVL